MVAHDLAAVLAEDRHEGVGDRLRSALRARPSDEVGEAAEHQADAGRERTVERQDRVRRQAGEQRRRAVAVEPAPPERRRRTQAVEAEAGQAQRVAGQRQRRRQVVDDGQAALDQRRHQPAPRGTVGAETGRGVVDRAVQQRGAAVERVGQRDRRVAPAHTVLGERQVTQRRRAEAERVDRRADVVAEARLGQLGGAAATARRRGRLEHDDSATGLGHRDRRDEAVGPGADDDGVVLRDRRHGEEPYRRRDGAGTVVPHAPAAGGLVRRRPRPRRRLQRSDDSADRDDRRRRHRRRRRPRPRRPPPPRPRRRPRRPPRRPRPRRPWRRRRRSCRSSRPRRTPSTTCARASSWPPTRRTRRCPSPA